MSLPLLAATVRFSARTSREAMNSRVFSPVKVSPEEALAGSRVKVYSFPTVSPLTVTVWPEKLSLFVSSSSAE